ncbi:helix-turn-helix domain-containing protein [Arthrobacter sp. B2a2-09]|uniref:helix-turn-helix domain-containing protein n=1 Tax=Arthrobacter sp. B2a2-09 TaxID=2952822 RepID=UPI0022CDA3BF|nr:helix-turn-helix transcriptional regulator [Arthrobacter sp. B2a2-09]MCZ9881920.1 helix-turn-helix domain-containing protein [Arthrobacter sp. B2a2-09]
MSTAQTAVPMVTPELVRARAKVLAREHRTMRSELVRLRREGGLTQGDVAERMGVSQQAVSKFERYDSDPKLSTVRRYANAVGALIEHRIERDQGQSVFLAAAKSDWVQMDVVNSLPVRGAHTRAVRLGPAAWSTPTSKQTDFDLAR